MLWPLIITLAVLLVAYANGANDNFKGVATLFGSGAANYRKALNWATLTTFSGAIAALFISTRLVKTFSGKGLVPDDLISQPVFLAAVALGAGLTVLFAARFGFPISTTHGLTGALAGAGLMAIGTELKIAALVKNFFLPLLLSPLLAVIGTALVYSLLHALRKACGITRQSCVCVGEQTIPLSQFALSGRQTAAAAEIRVPGIFAGTESSCRTKAVEAYAGKIFSMSAQSALNSLHFLSAGAVSFARGLNDTPKLMAVLAASGAIAMTGNLFLVAAVMALGGILSGRKVAETVSHKITAMNHGQGLAANLVTAVLVIFASRWGMPVSTTHVSCGALFGIGAVSGKARWKMISSILGAWFLTLPASAGLAAAVYFTLSCFTG